MLNTLLEKSAKVMSGATCPTNHLCSYDFDATAEDISSLYPHYCKYPVVEGQKFSFKAQANQESVFFAAYSKALITQIKDLNNGVIQTLEGEKSISPTGIVAFENELNVLPLRPLTNLPEANTGILIESGVYGVLSDGTYLMIGCGFATNQSINELDDTILGNAIVVKVAHVSTSGTLDFFQKLYAINETSLELQRIGIYINQNTKQIGFVLNGVDLGYLYNFNNLLQSAFFVSTSMVSQLVNDIGSEFSTEVITDHSRIKLEYPAGTTDICGNLIL
ncbi:DUF4882 family protein [Acinetobacter genomosp. 15BJ]|uniref:DUF4882 family protein n=1 Tax=Acinetobacter genomosp. 15BJ TaxID=106651 RepID=A0ABT8V1F0_9GAMM|nr:DUF4882 family protein [Acinetobacter genomosp. 15BJ]MDO3658006.1 DUF4882 family protein [Acinetobacter genomosp. 15BJ]